MECMEVSQLTHVEFVTPWERIPSARRQKTKDIEGRARNFSKLLKTSKPSKSSKLSQTDMAVRAVACEHGCPNVLAYVRKFTHMHTHLKFLAKFALPEHIQW